MTESDTYLARHSKIGLPERINVVRLEAPRRCVETLRCNRELVITAERYAELGASHREKLPEVRSRVAPDEAGFRRKAEHELYGAASRVHSTKLAKRGIPTSLKCCAPEVSRAAHRTAGLRNLKSVQRTTSGKG